MSAILSFISPSQTKGNTMYEVRIKLMVIAAWAIASCPLVSRADVTISVCKIPYGKVDTNGKCIATPDSCGKVKGLVWKDPICTNPNLREDECKNTTDFKWINGACSVEPDLIL